MAHGNCPFGLVDGMIGVDLRKPCEWCQYNDTLMSIEDAVEEVWLMIYWAEG